MSSDLTWSNCEYGLAGSLTTPAPRHMNAELGLAVDYISYIIFSMYSATATIVFSMYNEILPTMAATITSGACGYYIFKTKHQGRALGVPGAHTTNIYFYCIMIFYLLYNSSIIQTCLNIISYTIGTRVAVAHAKDLKILYN